MYSKHNGRSRGNLGARNPTPNHNFIMKTWDNIEAMKNPEQKFLSLLFWHKWMVWGNVNATWNFAPLGYMLNIIQVIN